jgi:hypothetical protein
MVKAYRLQKARAGCFAHCERFRPSVHCGRLAARELHDVKQPSKINEFRSARALGVFRWRQSARGAQAS